MFKKLKEDFVSDWKNNLFLLVLIGLLILFSLWRLPYSPATWFDEGINLGITKSLVNKGVYSLEVGPDEFVENRQFLITSNYPVLLPVAVSLKLFGFNLTAARLPMVLFLFLFLLAAYLLVKKLYSKQAAILALALIISFVPFYGNGKNVLGEIPGLFYFLAGLLLLSESWRWKRLFFAGVFFGLSAATKPFFLIVLPAVLAGELYFGYKNKALGKEFWKRIGIMAAGVFLPLIGWLATILPEFSLKGLVSMVNYYSNSYAATNFGSLIVSNFLRFFSETTPLHFLLLFLALFSVYWLKQKKGQLRKIEIILLVFIVINAFWYLKTPGWYRYFFPAHIILLLSFPAALIYLFKKKLAIAVIILLLLVQFPLLISKRNENLYNSEEAVIFSKAVIEQTKPNSKMLIINSPSIAFLLNNRRIYQYLQINPVFFFGENTLAQEGEPYPYIIRKGSLADVGIDGLEEALDSDYKIIKEFGHYVLYKNI